VMVAMFGGAWLWIRRRERRVGERSD
jgi:hypothetical protein